MRGTTRSRRVQPQPAGHFYPRTPCGVRPNLSGISSWVTAFLSTYPVRGTTRSGTAERQDRHISIHVPRAGYDLLFHVPTYGITQFLSTYPVRGTTPALHPLSHMICISIHVPRAGYDQLIILLTSFHPVFLSTYPVRGTTCSSRTAPQPMHLFLSTYPVRGTTAVRYRLGSRADISIHVPRAGYDSEIGTPPVIKGISIHVPRAGYDFSMRQERA